METEIINVARESLFILLKAATPILLVALLVGLSISLVQALTQIQEATLSFVPKIVAILLSLIVLAPMMASHLKDLADLVFHQIIVISAK